MAPGCLGFLLDSLNWIFGVYSGLLLYASMIALESHSGRRFGGRLEEWRYGQDGADGGREERDIQVLCICGFFIGFAYTGAGEASSRDTGWQDSA